MSREKIFKKVVEICLDVFDNDGIVITNDTCSADIEEWDSLSHFNLMSDIEDEFGIDFSLDESLKLKNIGELVGTIERKIN